jgi:hypothetical protein
MPRIQFCCNSNECMFLNLDFLDEDLLEFRVRFQRIQTKKEKAVWGLGTCSKQVVGLSTYTSLSFPRIRARRPAQGTRIPHPPPSHSLLEFSEIWKIIIPSLPAVRSLLFTLCFINRWHSNLKSKLRKLTIIQFGIWTQVQFQFWAGHVEA